VNIRLFARAAIAMLAVAGGGRAVAQDVQPEKMTISVIGAPATGNPWKRVEKPFFEETLPEESHGRITVNVRSSTEAGVSTGETARMVQDGVVNIGLSTFNDMAADDPRFAGMDLPGIGVTVDQARAAAESYRPIVAKLLAEKENLKLLTVQPNTMQVILCKGQITGLQYFRGKKVRVWARAMANYMEALGATTVTIPWEEALPAMQRGVADCGITSPSNANNAHWADILDSQMVIPLGGWALVFQSANLDWWNGLEPQTQKFLEQEFKTLEDRAWEQGAIDLQDGLDCNAGKDSCRFGIKADSKHAMTTVYPTDADLKLHAEILQDAVLKNWAQECGTECVNQWNATIGKTVGILAPMP
jgi:TRAP-type C4-dicarboxylate transport system substrate-binding protein